MFVTSAARKAVGRYPQGRAKDDEGLRFVGEESAPKVFDSDVKTWSLCVLLELATVAAQAKHTLVLPT